MAVRVRAILFLAGAALVTRRFGSRSAVDPGSVPASSWAVEDLDLFFVFREPFFHRL